MIKYPLFVCLILFSLPSWGTQYYISPLGSDSNNGFSTSAAWLSPNHAVNTGDVITAATGTTYSQANFTFGKWGTVSGSTTGSTANVATLICATPFGCTFTGTTAGMVVTASNWRVSGWVVTTTSGSADCFEAYPNGGTTIHHIIFDNDIANGCQSAGFASPPNGSAGVDYFVLIGDIVFNGTQETSECGSGISIWEPVNFDTLAGTHEYVSQTFTWANINGGSSGTNCAGGAPTDGEGIIFDTWDNSTYTGQGVAENNIAMFNGNSGLRVDATTHANVVMQYNTTYANEQDSGLVSSELGEFFQQEDTNVTFQFNVAVATVATVGSFPVYDFGLSFYSATYSGNVVDNNQGYNTAHPAYFTACQGSGCGSFSFGSGNANTNPTLSSPPASVPAAPSCSGSLTVPQCMAPLIAQLAPTTPANAAWGYQAPSNVSTYDPYYPLWLCNVSLPSGLVTPGCVIGTTIAGGTMSGGEIQ